MHEPQPNPPAAGDAALPASPAVTAVLVENHRRFLAFLERRVGSREVAEDLLQDAFVRGLTRAGQLRDEESVVAWFYRALRNALVDHWRRRGAERRAVDRAAAVAEESVPGVDEELQDTVCSCASALLETLKPEYAEAVRRVDLQGGSVKDYARESGITANNASVRLFRARDALRRQVERSCGTCAEHGCLDCTCGGPGRPRGRPPTARSRAARSASTPSGGGATNIATRDPSGRDGRGKMGLLIKNGEIVTAAERYVADLYCDGGTVAVIGRDLQKRAESDELIDASGQFVFPGFVDPHVHMELPVSGTVSADDFESGTASGVAGGTTCIVDFCIPNPGESCLDALRARREVARKAVADYSFHMTITAWGDRTADEMRAIVQDHGIPSFKVLLAYKGTVMVDDGALYEVMKNAARLGAVVAVHGENGEAVWHLQRELVAKGDLGPEFHPVSRPSMLEGEATARALMMARLHGATAYIVHMTCREAVEALVRAKLDGQRCYGETCPQYLLLDDRVFAKPDFEAAAYVLSPPIRPIGMGHHDALWRGLVNGMLDTVATDHCPFTMAQKRLGLGDFTLIPNGGAAIEDRLQLLYTYGVCHGRFDLQRMVAVGSTNPARIFGLYPRKGTIAVGSDADLVIYDPTSKGVRSAAAHHSRGDRNLFEGVPVEGRPTFVVVNGRIQFADGNLKVERGAGRFIARKPMPLHTPPHAPAHPAG